jgi:NAD(P)H-dependent flavin oxidoreductase YrpB (nitropropane dioxygenase family)
MSSIRPSNVALTYDDINLVPGYSEIESRSKINLTTQLTTNYSIRVPLVASPMDTVCDSEMAIAMADLGGVGCIHRFMTIEEQAMEAYKVFLHNQPILWENLNGKTQFLPIMAAVGANGDYLERAQCHFNRRSTWLSQVCKGSYC